MRTYRLVFIILSVGFTTNVFGQTYHPFPTNGTWHYQLIDEFGLTSQTAVLRLLGDTSIDNHDYKKLSYDGTYWGALRDSSHRIYFRSNDDTLEGLLYDFNLTTGDTFVVRYPLQTFGTCDTLVVVSEDSFNTLDGFRRRLNFFPLHCYPSEWVEGIGIMGWLLHPVFMGCGTGCFLLTCVYDSSQQIYSSFNGNCFYNVGIDEVNTSIKYHVYPNPTTGLLTLTHSDISSTISITDLYGRQLLFYNNSPTDIDISALSDGIYLLIVHTKNESRIMRIEKLGSR